MEAGRAVVITRAAGGIGSARHGGTKLAVRILRIFLHDFGALEPLLIAQFGPSLVRSETVRLASPIFGATIPDRYRDWKMIAVAHEGVLDELRGVLGNDVAVKGF